MNMLNHVGCPQDDANIANHFLQQGMQFRNTLKPPASANTQIAGGALSHAMQGMHV